MAKRDDGPPTTQTESGPSIPDIETLVELLESDGESRRSRYAAISTAIDSSSYDILDVFTKYAKQESAHHYSIPEHLKASLDQWVEIARENGDSLSMDQLSARVEPADRVEAIGRGKIIVEDGILGNTEREELVESFVSDAQADGIELTKTDLFDAAASDETHEAQELPTATDDELTAPDSETTQEGDGINSPTTTPSESHSISPQETTEIDESASSSDDSGLPGGKLSISTSSAEPTGDSSARKAVADEDAEPAVTQESTDEPTEPATSADLEELASELTDRSQPATDESEGPRQTGRDDLTESANSTHIDTGDPHRDSSHMESEASSLHDSVSAPKEQNSQPVTDADHTQPSDDEGEHEANISRSDSRQNTQDDQTGDTTDRIQFGDLFGEADGEQTDDDNSRSDQPVSSQQSNSGDETGTEQSEDSFALDSLFEEDGEGAATDLPKGDSSPDSVDSANADTELGESADHAEDRDDQSHSEEDTEPDEASGSPAVELDSPIGDSVDDEVMLTDEHDNPFPGQVSIPPSLSDEVDESVNMRTRPQRPSQVGDYLPTQDLLGFEYILDDDEYGPIDATTDGILKLGDGRFAGIARISPRSWRIHSSKRKQAIYALYQASFLLKLRYHTQIIKYPVELDMQNHIQEFRTATGEDPPTDIVRYGRKIQAQWLENFVEQNEVQDRLFAVVVTVSKQDIARGSDLIRSIYRMPMGPKIASYLPSSQDTISDAKCIRVIRNRLQELKQSTERDSMGLSVDPITDRDAALRILHYYYNDTMPEMSTFSGSPTPYCVGEPASDGAELRSASGGDD